MVVTRAHLKSACDAKNWDLLDKLLEIDASKINDNALFTDTWGEWWGLLIECIGQNEIDGVKVLLKHGAKRDVGTWGDCDPCSPLQAAKDCPEILELLESPATPTFIRKTDPPLPAFEKFEDQAVNRQGEIRDASGLVFQTAAIKPADPQ